MQVASESGISSEPDRTASTSDETFSSTASGSASGEDPSEQTKHTKDIQDPGSTTPLRSNRGSGSPLVTVVGDKSVRSDVPLSVLQQLYLPDQTSAFRKVNHEDKTLSYFHTPSFPAVKAIANHERKRILVTGGAGFVGSHLVDRLMLMGHEVTVLDNFFTGSKRNVQHWMGHPHFELIRHDVVDPFMIEVDQIYHLACPASPPHYQYNPIKTVKTSVMGTINMLGLAKRTKARFLLTSTSGKSPLNVN
jgi:UDP-glucuronate decarboxylase